MAERVGFFTDTSVCIGCKACEVACKEWNGVPSDVLGLTGKSYDNTGALGANTWRHVAFVEKPAAGGGGVKWLMSADVCKHCTRPACAKACATDSIQFGPLDELRERAAERVDALRAAGEESARLYGADPDDGVGGAGAFFLLLDAPETYGLPPDPVVTTRDLPSMWKQAALAAGAVVATVAAAFVGGR